MAGCKSPVNQSSHTSWPVDGTIAQDQGNTMLLFSRSQSAKVPRQVCHAEDEMEKDSRERELWNSPCVQLPKMTLIRESEMDRALPSNVAGTRNCGSSAFLVLPSTSIISPPLSQCWPCFGVCHSPGPAERGR